MKDLPFNKSGMKMIVESGHKAFDRQSNVISGGCNMLANTQNRLHVRPFNETNNGFQERPPGYLRDFDLHSFYRIPARVKKVIIDLTETEGVWVNVFFHYNGRNEVQHGWIIDRNHKCLKMFVTGPTYKSWYVMDYVKGVICDGAICNEEDW